MNKALAVYQVDKQEIMNCDITGILNAIKQAQNMLGNNACKAVAVFIDGYNDVSDELYEIPAVRAWVRKLFDKMPHVLYYINTDFSDHVYLINSLSDNIINMTTFERKPIEQYSFEEWDALPKIPVHFTLPTPIVDKIINSILRHGKNIGNKKGALEVANHWNSMFYN